MDVSVLQIFVEVMRQGSFAAVARDRGIDLSSVSRTIAGLEKEYGRKQRQQELMAGFTKRPTLRSRPGMMDAIAIQVVFD